MLQNGGSNDRGALDAIYSTTGGENWNNNTGWGQESDYCTWYGVSCDFSGRVYVLDLAVSKTSFSFFC